MEARVSEDMRKILADNDAFESLMKVLIDGSADHEIQVGDTLYTVEDVVPKKAAG
ncbi:MAG: hypothetical protein AAF488_17765 [Planctomycetota bacterium]